MTTKIILIMVAVLLLTMTLMENIKANIAYGFSYWLFALQLSVGVLLYLIIFWTSKKIFK